MIIGIQDEILRINSLRLLDRLLTDKTTKAHIIWGTDAYTELGEYYRRDKEITSDLITGSHSGVIKNRARKALEQQTERTRQHAEVFTPLWICEKMNDHADCVWFDRKTGIHKTDPENGHIIFTQSRKWHHYVDSRRLEITCGEAPYLVSRYDVSTGESIPLSQRIGILDRKLRAVTENAETEEEWLEWAVRAFQSTYGYEFQGDNVLIARVNLLETFEEYLFDRWKRKPTDKEYQTIINIICWNIWQMDGLTGTIPYCKAEEEYQQLDLFGWLGMETVQQSKDTQPRCRIYDWRRDNSLEFLAVNKGERNMKFDFIIGNPPYQDETIGDNKGFAPPIYHKFLENAYKIGDGVEMIHPARFLFNAGSTPKEWNKRMLEDKHLKILLYEPDATKIFPNTSITGGITISYHDANVSYPPIAVFSPFVELNTIRQKVETYDDFCSFGSIISGRTPYLFTDKMHSDFPEAEAKLSKGHRYDVSSNVFAALPEIFMTEMPDSPNEFYRVLGRLNNNRAYCWVRKEYVRGRNDQFIGKWKVFLPKANGASGMLGEEAARLISKPVVGKPDEIATDTFLCVGSFDTEVEANAALHYMNSKFCRVLLGVLKVTQDNSPDKWKYVPLQDFTSASDIDWSKSVAEIDRQLYEKYGLDDKEIEFIEAHVKEMA